MPPGESIGGFQEVRPVHWGRSSSLCRSVYRPVPPGLPKAATEMVQDNSGTPAQIHHAFVRLPKPRKTACHDFIYHLRRLSHDNKARSSRLAQVDARLYDGIIQAVTRYKLSDNT